VVVRSTPPVITLVLQERSQAVTSGSDRVAGTDRPGMGDSLDGSGEPSPESQNVAIVEFPTFANYLRKAVTVLLPDEDAVPPAFNLALEDRYNQDCIRKFLGDSQVNSLYVQRSSSKGERRSIDRSHVVVLSSFLREDRQRPAMRSPPLSLT